jgi:hypothetical protein
LNDRIAQAKRAALKDLGFDDSAAAKAALEAGKAASEAQMTEVERLQKRAQDAEALTASLPATEKAAGEAVEALILALPADQQKAVRSQAGEDWKAALKLVTFLRDAGLNSAPAPSTATADALANPPPATTGPAGAPPSPAPTRTKFDEYAAIKNPSARSIFYRANRAEIDATRPADS